MLRPSETKKSIQFEQKPRILTGGEEHSLLSKTKDKEVLLAPGRPGSKRRYPAVGFKIQG